MIKYIFLDARFYNRSGIGRYIAGVYQEIIENIPSLRVMAAGDKLILKESFFKEQQIIPFYSPVYSLKEQIEGSFLIERFRKTVHVFHFPHYNVPWLLPSHSVVTIHDLTQFLFPNFFSKMKRMAAAFVLRNVMKRAGRIVVGSNSTATDLAKRYPELKDKVRVVQYGISKFFSPLPEDEVLAFKRSHGIENYILYVGNRKPHKNIGRLLEAFCIIRRSHKTLELILIGEKFPERDPINEWRKKSGFKGDGIREVTEVSDETLQKYYCGAKLLVNPSLNEGFGFPPLEAMACGVPVVVSKISSLPEVCGDAALYVNPYHIPDMAMKIQMALEDERLRNDLVQKGLKQASSFSWKKCVEETVKVFEEVMGE